MLLINKITSLFKRAFHQYDNCQVFNGNEISFISEIELSPKYKFRFSVYLKTGQVFVYTQEGDSNDSYRELSLLHELFINNIGFSCFRVDLNFKRISYKIIKE